MIHRVSCSADSISRLTNLQIRYIIDQVNSKTVNDQSHETEKFPPANPQGSERTDEVVRVGEEYLASLGIVDENTEGATSKISDDDSFHFFSDEPGHSNHPTANADVVKETSG